LLLLFIIIVKSHTEWIKSIQKIIRVGENVLTPLSGAQFLSELMLYQKVLTICFFW